MGRRLSRNSTLIPALLMLLPSGASRAGVHDIPDQALVEGSVTNGGLQPHYLINLEDPALQPLIVYAREIAAKEIPAWQKVALIKDRVRGMIQKKSYRDPDYFALMEEYRLKGEPIPLGEYVCLSAGVCREHALLTHLALKEAGLPNQYVYARVRYSGPSGATEEDHAFTLWQDDAGKLRVVDSYNTQFDGAAWEELLAGKVEGNTKRTLVQLHPFPRVWPNCAHWFERLSR